MDTEIIQKFIEEAEIYLPTIRRGILLCSQDGKFHEELKTSIRTVHTVKGAAFMVGLDEIGNLSADLEAELESAVSAGEPLRDEHLRRMLDKVSRIEAQLADLHFSTGDFSLDLTDFVEESFENLQTGGRNFKTAGEKPPEKPEEKIEEEFEIDDEMREVFALEAEDLLRNIGSHLEILEKSPNSREALLEIRRSAHTLKGSAGIVGLKNLSRLAHRVEDLLDYLAEHEIEADKRIFELLSSSTDCLNSLANNDVSEQLTKKIAQVGEKFDEVMASFKEESTENSTEKKPQTAETKEAEIVEQPQNPAGQNRSIIRVSLEKLDDLVRLVSEMVISRSVFEQRLAELGRQIEARSGFSARPASSKLISRRTRSPHRAFFSLHLTPRRIIQTIPAALPNSTCSNSTATRNFTRRRASLPKRPTTLRRLWANSKTCAAISKFFSITSAA
jgi:chemosensory pili system protein ChpA (sensor histidine kinase/response regulator)